MVHVVEVRVMGQGIAQVDANGFPDLPRAGMARFQMGLDGLQPCGFGVAFRRQAHLGRQAEDRLLGEVLGPHAAVARPFIHGRIGRIIHGREGQFVQPIGDATFPVDVPDRLAGAHGDAQDGVDAQGHGASQRGDFAIVDDLQGHAEFLSDALEHGADFVEAFRWDAPIEGRDPRLIVHIRARGTAADGIHPREMASGFFQRPHDVLVMVVGVGLMYRFPYDFRAEDGLAIDDRRDLDIGRAQVEPDAITLQMAAQGLAAFLGRGHLIRVADLHGEGAEIDQIAHELGIEGPFAIGRVEATDVLADVARPAHDDLPAAPLPEQELHQAFGVEAIFGSTGMVGWEDDGFIAGAGALGALQRDDQRHAARGFCCLAKGAIGQDSGTKVRIKGWLGGGRNQLHHGKVVDEAGE